MVTFVRGALLVAARTVAIGPEVVRGHGGT